MKLFHNADAVHHQYVSHSDAVAIVQVSHLYAESTYL